MILWLILAGSACLLFALPPRLIGLIVAFLLKFKRR